MTLGEAIKEAKSWKKAKIAMHIPGGKRYWEIPPEEIHACVLTYTDWTSEQWHSLEGGQWINGRPACFCGYEFEPDDFKTIEESEGFLGRLMGRYAP